MRKIYATLLSAFLLGSLVCAGCTDKNKTASKEVIDIIHKVMPLIIPEIWKPIS